MAVLVALLLVACIALVAYGLYKVVAQASGKRGEHIYGGPVWSKKRRYPGELLQAFETIVVMSETRQIDIVYGRSKMLVRLLPKLVEYTKLNSRQYNSYVQLMLEEYRGMYYDKPVKSWVVNYIKNPETLAGRLPEFVAANLTDAFDKNVNYNCQDMLGLKTERAKKNRYNKLVVLADQVKVYLADLGQMDLGVNVDRSLMKAAAIAFPSRFIAK